MSKVGEVAIEIPELTNIHIMDHTVNIKGQKEEISVNLPEGISIAIEGNKVKVLRKTDSQRQKALHGLIRSLINNAVLGMQKPWEKKLKVVGTGFKVRLQGEDLIFDVGFSHSVTFKKVEGVMFEVKGNSLKLLGANKQLVGEVANKIRSIRKPDAYKGKGIRYENEVVKLKPGKKAKTTE